MQYVALAFGGLQAMGALMQGRSAAEAARYDQAVAEQNAGIARAGAAEDVAQKQRDAAKLMGAQTTAYSASGVRSDVGTPLDVAADSAYAAKLDQLTTTYRGELAARSYGQQAYLSDKRAKNATLSGLVGAGTALLQSAYIAKGGRVPTYNTGAGTPAGPGSDGSW